MRVLMINGSRREKGCTFTALSEVAKELNAAGIQTEIMHVGADAVTGNIDKIVKEACEKIKDCDGLVIGSPVYYASPSGEVIAFLDRLFMAAESDLRLKPAAAVASARRGGTTTTLDVLDKYIEYCEMPLISSHYWPMVHCNSPEEVMQDKEGLQVMRVLGRNMSWLLKCIKAGEEAGIARPEAVEKERTSFIR